jgi:lipopolysaccharide biosynthesis glycosyltransferase
VFNRERHPLQSNDFSFSRWLVPHLCDYRGWAIFTDCDMLCRTDIAELWALRDSQYAVQVVKHNHIPKEQVKYLDAVQTKYEKKNWSSVMLFNNEKCKALTPEYIHTAHGLDLHQFKWLESDDLIGGLPKEWNHLVGYNEPNKNAKIAHFTVAGPWLTKAKHCEFGDAWREERDAMMYFQDWVD